MNFYQQVYGLALSVELLDIIIHLAKFKLHECID